MEQTTITEPALDWQADPDLLDATKRLAEAQAMLAERQTARDLLWEWKFSADRFEQARHRAQWQEVDAAYATAEAYAHQAHQRFLLAEQQAKAAAQVVWDDRFREAWRAIETVLTGPLLAAIRDYEALTCSASNKQMIVPQVLLPNVTSETVPQWIAWVRKELGIQTA